MTESPIQEYADVLEFILTSRGFSVGNKHNWGADITLNIIEEKRVTIIGCQKLDRFYGIAVPDGANITICDRKFNLAHPDSFEHIGDLFSEMVKTYPQYPGLASR